MKMILFALPLLLVAPLVARAEDAPFDKTLDSAWKDLEQLETLLDDRHATNKEITSYMDVVMDEAASLAPPAAEGDDATQTPDQQRRMAAWNKSIDKFRDSAVDLLLDALGDTEFERSGQNRREPVNAHAGPLLARTAAFVVDPKDRKRLSRRIIRKIKRFERSRHPVSASIFEGAFSALAGLDEPSSLEWLMSNYLYTKKQPEAVRRLRAALRSMRKFQDIPGRLRHDLVDEMLKRYVAVEALAEQSTTDVSAIAAKRFWDQIRTDVIPLIQYAAGYPKTQTGAALATMHDFSVWYRDHDNPHSAPWTTEVETAAG